MKSVAERIRDRDFSRVPGRVADAGPGVAIISAYQFTLQPGRVIDLNPNGGARRRIAMMLAQMQHAALARHFHVERRIVVEAVFPPHRKAEKPDIELLRLLDIEMRRMGVTAPNLAMWLSWERDEPTLAQLQQPLQIIALELRAQRIAEPLADGV